MKGLLATAVACGACLVCAGAAGARAPAVEQLVVFRSGKAVQRKVSTASVRARVGRRRCAVPSRTALSALIRARPGRIRFHDYGSCSARARGAAGLFVSGIGRDLNRGQRGWVYKVGRKAATAGAADPAGPFGRGRLRAGQHVLWFYCLRATRCQRTLQVRTRVVTGALGVTVTGYDDQGRGARVAGATVHVGAVTATTRADGRVLVSVPRGSYRVHAEKPGLVRSFSERITVG